MIRLTIGFVVSSAVIILIGDLVPSAPERLRGTTFTWSFYERSQTFAMYHQSAVNSLNSLKEIIDKSGHTQALLSDPTPQSPAELCLGILTARRHGSQKSYLTQLLGSLVTRMDLPQHDVSIHVFNVDANPSEHIEVKNVPSFIPVSNIKAPASFKGEEKVLDPKFQEILDYAAVLRKLEAAGCRSSLLVEDDALAAESWKDQVEEALRQVRSQYSKWLFVRLYAPRDYARVPRGQQRLYNYKTYSTVAVLFNGEETSRMADTFEKHIEEVLQGKAIFKPKDALLNAFSEGSGFPSLSFEPVVFQHTGIHSTVCKRDLEKGFPLYMSARNFKSEGSPIYLDRSRLHFLN
jgi:hypothetical protein